MITADRGHITKRLRELVEWAEYIVQSLSADQAYERGKLELLEETLGGETLVGLRLEARTLASHLKEALAQTQSPAVR